MKRLFFVFIATFICFASFGQRYYSKAESDVRFNKVEDNVNPHDSIYFKNEVYTKAQSLDKIDSVKATISSSAILGNKFVAPFSYNGLGQNAVNDACTANAVYAVRFFLPFTIDATRIGVAITTGVAAATVNCAIYSADGATKLIDKNIAADNSGFQSGTFTQVTLPAGFYWCAYSNSANTVRCKGWANQNIAGLEADVTVLGISPNSTSAGVMPSSLGTIVTTTGNNLPFIIIK